MNRLPRSHEQPSDPSLRPEKVPFWKRRNVWGLGAAGLAAVISVSACASTNEPGEHGPRNEHSVSGEALREMTAEGEAVQRHAHEFATEALAILPPQTIARPVETGSSSYSTFEVSNLTEEELEAPLADGETRSSVQAFFNTEQRLLEVSGLNESSDGVEHRIYASFEVADQNPLLKDTTAPLSAGSFTEAVANPDSLKLQHYGIRTGGDSLATSIDVRPDGSLLVTDYANQAQLSESDPRASEAIQKATDPDGFERSLQAITKN